MEKSRYQRIEQLAEKMPEQVKHSKELFRRLNAMNASYPYLNPFTKVRRMEKTRFV